MKNKKVKMLEADIPTATAIKTLSKFTITELKTLLAYLHELTSEAAEELSKR